MTDYLGGALDVNNIPVDDKREKLKERIANIVCMYDTELLNSNDLAERILKEIEKEER
jgi:hypothetical protein